MYGWLVEGEFLSIKRGFLSIRCVGEGENIVFLWHK